MKMNNTKWKSIAKKILKVLFIILIIISVVVVSAVGYFFFIRWHRDQSELESGDKTFIGKLLTTEKEEEPLVTCLFMGVNGNLTDFIMLGQYNPNNRKIALLSIPRDTNVGSASVDGKINSIYSSKGRGDKGIEALKTKVTEITGIEIDYHVLFKTKILRQVVDEMGGVTVDVPINMNYDDPEQGLYIHLKKGTQKLTGTQAEGFCRFRKNNDGTGYPRGDIQRTEAQQQFIKAFISELLKTETISKIPNLINIVLEGTQTNVTLDIAKNYVDDVIAIKLDRISTNTLPGSAAMGDSPLGYRTSYYYYNEEESKAMIDEMFHDKTESSGDVQEVNSSSVVTKDHSGEDVVRVELLNAGASSVVINNLVDSLKAENFYVVKIGNYNSTKKEASKIIDYGTATSLDELKTVTKISKIETSSEDATVAYTIIVGPNYK